MLSEIQDQEKQSPPVFFTERNGKCFFAGTWDKGLFSMAKSFCGNSLRLSQICPDRGTGSVVQKRR